MSGKLQTPAANQSSLVQSMTGFSTVQEEIAGRKLRLEIKSLNHRYLDLKTRLPRDLGSIDLSLRAYFQRRFHRGAIEIRAEWILSEGEEVGASFNSTLAARYFAALSDLRTELGIQAAVSLSDVISLPEVVARSAPEVAKDDAWPAIEPIVQMGVDALIASRVREGQDLSAVLYQALDDLTEAVKRIRIRRAECELEYGQKISAKVAAVFESYPLAAGNIQAVLESRVSQELAMLIERTDIQEELVRFTSHLGHFRSVLKATGPVGRKLDFMSQELGREVNTLGNKAQDVIISQDVVLLKVRLEQIREQIMNLE